VFLYPAQKSELKLLTKKIKRESANEKKKNYGKLSCKWKSAMYYKNIECPNDSV